MLWNTLSHPPATFLGHQHQFRKADGSYNSLENPDLGKSGTHYARSVQSTHLQAANTLPDPGLVFDTLLKARKVQSSLLYNVQFFIDNPCSLRNIQDATLQ